jgi:hypothetical protein
VYGIIAAISAVLCECLLRGVSAHEHKHTHKHVFCVPASMRDSVWCLRVSGSVLGCAGVVDESLRVCGCVGVCVGVGARRGSRNKALNPKRSTLDP